MTKGRGLDLAGGARGAFGWRSGQRGLSWGFGSCRLIQGSTRVFLGLGTLLFSASSLGVLRVPAGPGPPGGAARPSRGRSSGLPLPQGSSGHICRETGSSKCDPVSFSGSHSLVPSHLLLLTRKRPACAERCEAWESGAGWPKEPGPQRAVQQLSSAWGLSGCSCFPCLLLLFPLSRPRPGAGDLVTEQVCSGCVPVPAGSWQCERCLVCCSAGGESAQVRASDGGL